MNNYEMNVIYSSDNNYVQHMGVSIWSLLEKNTEFKRINIYIIENKIDKENKNKIESFRKNFSNLNIIWISFEEYEKQLKLDMEWEIAISAYARLFVGEMLPLTVKKILYLDCDTVICDSLVKLWDFNLKNKIVGVIQDTVGDEVKIKLDIPKEEKYFNSGVLLIDMDNWRKNQIGNKCIQLIQEYKGNVCHHDQGVLNAVLKDYKSFIPMRYNMITVHYFFDMKKIRKYYSEKAPFYSDQEIEFAKNHPAILHFTPSFTSRPWIKGCLHPYRKMYWDVLRKTPWKDQKPQKNKTKCYIRLVEWRYRVLPF